MSEPTPFHDPAGEQERPEGSESTALATRDERGSLPILRPPVDLSRVADPAPDRLRRLVAALARRKAWILGPALLFLGIAALEVFTTTPLYRAGATLEIEPGEARREAGEMAPGVDSARSHREYLQTQVVKLGSRSVAERASRELNLAEDSAFHQDAKRGVVTTQIENLRRLLSGGGGKDRGRSGDSTAAGRVQRTLEAAAVPGTFLIRLDYVSPDPELAARVANGIVQAHLDLDREMRLAAAQRLADALREALGEVAKALRDSQKALLVYAQDHDFVDLEQKLGLSEQKLSDLSAELTRAETELISRRASFEAVRNLVPADLPQMLETDTIGSLTEKLIDRSTEIAGAATQGGPDAEETRRLRVELQHLEKEIENERQRVIDSIMYGYQLAQDNSRALGSAVSGQQAEVGALQELALEYGMLHNEVEANGALFAARLTTLREAEYSLNDLPANLLIAEAALAPATPVGPARWLWLVSAAGIGLALGLLVAGGLALWDVRVWSEEDVARALRIPTVGSAPEFWIGGGSGWIPPWLKKAPSPFPAVAYPPLGEGEMRAQEAYRSLRASIKLSIPGNAAPQVILVTSPLRREGRSTTAVNLAMAFAETGERTALVDLDMRNPIQAELFGIESQHGMSTFLSGTSYMSSEICETPYHRLFLIPSGPEVDNPAELIGSERLSMGITLLREYFNNVIVDCPAALEVSDALMASQHVDAVLLTARSASTPRRSLKMAAERFVAVGVPVLGVWINGVKTGAKRA